MAARVHTFVQILSPVLNNPDHFRERSLRFQEQLFDLEHATDSFSIIFSSPNLEHTRKVCKALRNNKNLTKISFSGVTSSNFDPSRVMKHDDEIMIYGTIVAEMPNLRSLKLGYQVHLNGPYSQLLESSPIKALHFAHPDPKTLLFASTILDNLVTLGIDGSGTTQDNRDEKAFASFITNLSYNTSVKVLHIDGFGMMDTGTYSPMKSYFSVLEENSTIEEIYLNFRIRHIDPHLEVLADVLKKNTTVKKVVVEEYHREHQDEEEITELLHSVFNESPNMETLTFCGKTWSK